MTTKGARTRRNMVYFCIIQRSKIQKFTPTTQKSHFRKVTKVGRGNDSDVRVTNVLKSQLVGEAKNEKTPVAKVDLLMPSREKV